MKKVGNVLENMFACLRAYLCVDKNARGQEKVRVCVCARERKRKRELERESEVVCLCEREREREGGSWRSILNRKNGSYLMLF